VTFVYWLSFAASAFSYSTISETLRILEILRLTHLLAGLWLLEARGDLGRRDVWTFGIVGIGTSALKTAVGGRVLQVGRVVALGWVREDVEL
jgi:hypothetical protein